MLFMERFHLIQRKFFDGRDFLLVLSLLLAASLVYFFYLFQARRAEDERYAEIRVDGRIDAIVSLSEDGSYTPAGLPAVRIAVRGGAVGFVSSDCPDKICIHAGFLSIPGQSAVGLPNRVAVQVAARGEETLDSVAY
jgi:hypothetical protein